MPYYWCGAVTTAFHAAVVHLHRLYCFASAAKVGLEKTTTRKSTMCENCYKMSHLSGFDNVTHWLIKISFFGKNSVLKWNQPHFKILMKQFQKAIFKHCESLFLSRFLQLFFSSLVIEAKGHAVVINDAFCTKILQDISRSLKKARAAAWAMCSFLR